MCSLWKALSALFLLLLLSLSLTAQAGKYMYDFGGAGDAADAQNIFTSNFISQIRDSRNSGWQNQVLFNGNHPSDLKKLQEETATPAQPFTSQNFDHALQQLTNKNLGPGDQVIINVLTHGSPDNGITNGQPDSSHLVSCSDTDCNMANLEPVIKALEKKGVQVAVIDRSCYSGRSLDLHDSNTCVITSTTDDDVGWNNFDTSLQRNLKSGRSLEDAFLSARSSSLTLGRAQISTRAGALTTAMIEDMGKESRFALDIDDVANFPLVLPCDQASAAKNVRETIRQFKDIELSIAIQNYAKATKDYQAIYANVQKIAKAYEKYAIRTTPDSTGFRFKWSDWVSFDSPEYRAKYPDYAKIVDKLNTNPDFLKMKSLQAQFDQLTKSTDVDYKKETRTYEGGSQLAQAAVKAQQAEKILYDLLYKKNSAFETKGNACANFIF